MCLDLLRGTSHLKRVQLVHQIAGGSASGDQSFGIFMDLQRLKNTPSHLILQQSQSPILSASRHLRHLLDCCNGFAVLPDPAILSIIFFKRSPARASGGLTEGCPRHTTFQRARPFGTLKAFCDCIRMSKGTPSGTGSKFPVQETSLDKMGVHNPKRSKCFHVLILTQSSRPSEILCILPFHSHTACSLKAVLTLQLTKNFGLKKQLRSRKAGPRVLPPTFFSYVPSAF